MTKKIAVLAMCLAALCAPGYGAAPTFQELMDPSVFPDAQHGMAVESAAVKDGTLRVTTTGAELVLGIDGKGSFTQRIGHARRVLVIQIEGGLKSAPELTHNGPGLAFARYGERKLDVRANGDSLFMFQVHEPASILVKREMDVAWTASDGANHLALDEWGGYGLYCSEKDLKDEFDAFGSIVARYKLPSEAVLWVSVCPPKPYDWPRSLTDNVVWHWSNTLGYPPDDQLTSWAQEGNIVLLQSEVMLWKDWNLAFVPRLGVEEFARVRKTMHDHGMRFIVYTSPYYFLKDTPLESKAMNSFENFKGFAPGRGVGDNIDVFMAEITKVMREYKPDGLYFDGQYVDSPAALYALARRARGLLGDEGILEWHSTEALGKGLCYLPQADAYVDFILRGEGRDQSYGDFNYLRYFVSGYNASNSIGVICNNGSKPSPALVRQLLESNCRMHTLAGWLDDAQTMDVVRNEYKAALTPSLRGEVERLADLRQRHVGVRARALADERRALAEAPVWDRPLLTEAFDAVPAWLPSVSPQNGDAFAVMNGVLAVTGKAHTYAYLTRPVGAPLSGLVIKLRQHTDGGMSWGPGVCVRWKSGAFLRAGLRSDGLIQSDIGGEQRLGGHHDPARWTWLRARWLGESGVIESSADGLHFEQVLVFNHGGALAGDVETVSVGKVPYNGQPKDNAEVGAAGTCLFDEVALYGRR